MCFMLNRHLMQCKIGVTLPNPFNWTITFKIRTVLMREMKLIITMNKIRIVWGVLTLVRLGVIRVSWHNTLTRWRATSRRRWNSRKVSFQFSELRQLLMTESTSYLNVNAQFEEKHTILFSQLLDLTTSLDLRLCKLRLHLRNRTLEFRISNHGYRHHGGLREIIRNLNL
jgi:hypothetical protein